MKPFEIARRIRAFEAGEPLPRGKTIRTFLTKPEDTLLLVFLRMGGISTPWAVAWGHPGGKMSCASTPNPRIARLARQPMLEFAPHLLQHLFHPDFKQGKGAFSPENKSKDRLRQIWLANSSHLEMLHQIAFRYERTKEGEAAEVKTLTALSRATNFLFQEAQRPGQMTIHKATTALKEAFSVPADDIRQGHLGFLMAWLDDKIPLNKKLEAAAHAETASISSTLSPEVERKELTNRVEQFGEAFDGSGANAKKAEAIQAEIHAILERECKTRFDLMTKAWSRLRADKREQNPGLGLLVEKSNDELVWNYLSIEKKFHEDDGANPFIISPETDHVPMAAAKRYINHSYSEALQQKALIQYDDDLLAEEFASGNAIRGKIVEVRDEKTDRVSIPKWIIECPAIGPLRLREGSGVYMAKDPKMAPEIVGVDVKRDAKGKELLVFELYFDEQKRRAVDPSWEGKTVTFLSQTGEGFLAYKMSLVWKNSGPGAWLTHQKGKKKDSA